MHVCLTWLHEAPSTRTISEGQDGEDPGSVRTSVGDPDGLAPASVDDSASSPASSAGGDSGACAGSAEPFGRGSRALRIPQEVSPRIPTLTHETQRPVKLHLAALAVRGESTKEVSHWRGARATSSGFCLVQGRRRATPALPSG